MSDDIALAYVPSRGFFVRRVYGAFLRGRARAALTIALWAVALLLGAFVMLAWWPAVGSFSFVAGALTVGIAVALAIGPLALALVAHARAATEVRVTLAGDVLRCVEHGRTTDFPLAELTAIERGRHVASVRFAPPLALHLPVEVPGVEALLRRLEERVRRG